MGDQLGASLGAHLDRGPRESHTTNHPHGRNKSYCVNDHSLLPSVWYTKESRSQDECQAKLTGRRQVPPNGVDRQSNSSSGGGAISRVGQATAERQTILRPDLGPDTTTTQTPGREMAAATPNQLYRLNKLGMLVVVDEGGKPLTHVEADELIRGSSWDGSTAHRKPRGVVGGFGSARTEQAAHIDDSPT